MADWEKRCPGCMKTVNSLNVPCPHCGFDREKYEQKRNPRTLPPGTVLDNQYLIGKVIGEGGFGITYLAWWLKLEIPVAIKEYFPSGLATRNTQSGSPSVIVTGGEKEVHYYESGLRSFEQEARNLAKFLKLPGVVQVMGLFSENQTAYLVMEYVPGINMKDYIRSRGNRLNEKMVLRLMRPLMESLDKVHNAGIIHRDISPDNILITQNQEVTLIDFGAARMASNNDGKSMTILLKHGYAPVEQYQTNGKQGPWTDIYALSATIYRMISGKVPQESVDRLSQDNVKPLSMLAREENFQVSQNVSNVIQKGLSVRAEHRYHNMQEMIRDLYGDADDRTVDYPGYQEPVTGTTQRGRTTGSRTTDPRTAGTTQNDQTVGWTQSIQSGAGQMGNGPGRNDRRPMGEMRNAAPPAQEKSPAGIILAILAVLAAVVAILGFVIFMKSGDSQDSQDGEKQGDSKEAVTQTATPEPTLEPITARLVDINQVNLADYKQIHVASADSSSVIQQDNGAINTPIMIFDENIETNWQEGVEGSGIGEWVEAQFSQESSVKYLTFKLGNWKTNRYYYGNNKPSKMTITMGEFSQQVQFPDEWTEFCLEFSRPCEADSLTITIDGVYRGTDWDDTCITDMRIFAEE